MNIDTFRDMLARHKDVIVSFPSLNVPDGYFSEHFRLDDKGNIRILFDYNQTVYFVCNINDDDFSKYFKYMRLAASITPHHTKWYQS